MATKKDEQTDDPKEVVTEMTQPIIIDLGKQKPKKIKSLKEGEGKLWEEVLEVVDEVKTMLGEEADGKTMIPVVLIYQKSTKQARIEKLLFPLADWIKDEEDE